LITIINSTYRDNPNPNPNPNPNSEKFQVIFFQQHSPVYIYRSSYYQTLQEILNVSGVIFINLFAEYEENRLHVLPAVRTHFVHVGLIEFDDYQNIVLVLSQLLYLINNS